MPGLTTMVGYAAPHQQSPQALRQAANPPYGN